MKTCQLITAAVLYLQIHGTFASRNSRKLAPEDFGEAHNRICLQVRDRIAEKTPTSKGEAFRYLNEELMTLCAEDDSECRSKMKQYSLRAQHQNYKYRDHETIIDDIMPFTLNDVEVRNTLKDIYYSIDLLDTMGVDDLKATILGISNDYKETDNHQGMKDLVEVTASVAASSVELWMGVFTDPDDAFHKLSGDGRKLLVQERFLQEEDPNLVTAAGFMGTAALRAASDVIRSDVKGAIEYSVRPAIEAVIMGGDTSELSKIVLGGVVIESVAAAFLYLGVIV